MTKLPMIFFVLLAPVLFVLVAVPVAIVHIAAHVLIDRMRRPDPRGATPIRTAVARATRPTWKSPILQSISTRS
ncbi:MAG TPA: hypothetical protein VN903_22075 [Polyangia bacterium]|jgi:hypothetical protein|nr:hypothetical protein [Polyangia bacterium]